MLVSPHCKAKVPGRKMREVMTLGQWKVGTDQPWEGNRTKHLVTIASKPYKMVGYDVCFHAPAFAQVWAFARLSVVLL